MKPCWILASRLASPWGHIYLTTELTNNNFDCFYPFKFVYNWFKKLQLNVHHYLMSNVNLACDIISLRNVTMVVSVADYLTL